VGTRNFGAIELYRRLGYRTDGVLYGYYSWGEDAYSMSKILPMEPVSAVSAEEDSSRMININQ
jgi:ribosomal protein S18 acetylase RimI-like enzyme